MYVKGRFWKRASLSIGAPLGNLEGGSFTRDFERKMKFLFYQETMFAGQSERYVKEGSGNGQLSLHRDPFEERGGGFILSGTLRYR